MSILIEEKIIQIMAVYGTSYESANNLLASLGGGYSSAEKVIDFLKHGLTISQIKDFHQKGLFKYDTDAILQTILFKN